MPVVSRCGCGHRHVNRKAYIQAITLAAELAHLLILNGVCSPQLCSYSSARFLRNSDPFAKIIHLLIMAPGHSNYVFIVHQLSLVHSLYNLVCDSPPPVSFIFLSLLFSISLCIISPAECNEYYSITSFL